MKRRHPLAIAALLGIAACAPEPPAIPPTPITPPTEVWESVGVVAVDSGQLLLVDPGNVDAEWIATGTGTSWQVRYAGRDADKVRTEFGTSPIACQDHSAAQTLDQRIRDHCQLHDLQANHWIESGSSYEQCDALTTTPLGHGQLNYRIGDAGLGIAAASGYGNGVYPVYARRNEEGVLTELRILFDEESETQKRLKAHIEAQRKETRPK